MRRIIVALSLAVLIAPIATGQDKTAVMATVRQFVDAFNKGDTKAALATCADQTSIIDEFPPHEWHGAGACQKWMDDYEADARKNDISDGLVTLSSPRHVEITAERAYVVVPATYTYKQKGKPMKETNSLFTLVLQKAGTGWRITAWAWSKN